MKGISSHRLAMSSAPLLALLGVIFLLPCTLALDCQWASIESVWDVSKLPLKWTNGKKTCDIGEGCQDTLILIGNGPQVNLVLTKGCTTAEDQEVQITEHRTGPGLSVISYTHVCRSRDLCNDLATTVPLWSLPTVKGLGTLRCPVCFSSRDCPENPPEQICPEGHTHCYNGVLKLRGGGIATNLRVQGCMPRPGCDLLNGTQKIGPIDVSENCNSKSDAQALECKRGTIESVKSVSELPLQWTTGWESCEIGEGCQETVILLVNGPQLKVIISKGCTKAQDHGGRVTEHRAGPGLTMVSYTRVCRSRDLCNDLSATDAFWSPSPPAVLGTLRCPVCFSSRDCPENPPEQICPEGHTHCYNGVLKLRGGGIATNLRVQGCMPRPGCDLLNGTQKIGPIDVSENCSPKSAPWLSSIRRPLVLDNPRSRTQPSCTPCLCRSSSIALKRPPLFRFLPDAVLYPRPGGQCGWSNDYALTCQRGIMLKMGRGLAQEVIEWSSFRNQTCDAEELCQETLLLIDSGHKSLLVGSKGCSQAGTQESRAVSLHSKPPGVLVASYARFCSADLCNDASSSSVLLTSLPKPAAPAPGNLRCPVCVQISGSCSENSDLVTCPKGTTHCYDGNIAVRGGGLISTLGIQGCMIPASRSLLNHAHTIGIFSVQENFKDNEGDNSESFSPNGGPLPHNLLWVVGLGLSIALGCGGLCPPW